MKSINSAGILYSSFKINKNNVHLSFFVVKTKNE